MTATNIHYEVADRVRATGAGGIGAIHLLVKKLGLDQLINQHLNLLKIHLPYHESDHVLSIAYNLLAGGNCWSTLNCCVAMRHTSTCLAHAASQIRQLLVISVDALTLPTPLA